MGLKDTFNKSLDYLKIGAKNKALNPSAFTPRVFAPTFIINGQPVWRNLSELSYLITCYHENFLVNAVINIRADAKANRRRFVRDLVTLEETPLNEYVKDGGILKKLLLNPNPLQSDRERIKQKSVNYDIFGESYTYATVPIPFDVDYKNITTLKNLAPYCVAPVLTGKFLEATQLDEIITRYDFTIGGKPIPIDVKKVLHMNNVNVMLDQNFTKGSSKLIPLQKPISNIDEALKARNVMIVKKGALGIISPKASNLEVGGLPFTPGEIKQLHESFDDYGISENQKAFMLSPTPMEFTKIAMNVKDLGLFEEVSLSGMPICYAYGVPPELAKNWITTGTLGTDSDEAQKRMYSDSIIPETDDDDEADNEFLKLRDFGIEIFSSFDHLKFLQADKKKEAETNQIISATAEREFFSALITYGQYANRVGVELVNESRGKLLFTDLTPEEQNAIRPKKAAG